MKIIKKIFMIAIFIAVICMCKEVLSVYTSDGTTLLNFSSQNAKNMIKDYKKSNYRGLQISSPATGDDSWRRMYFSRTMCIHPHAGQIYNAGYTYAGIDIIKINENEDQPSKARCLDMSTYVTAKRNSRMAFLAYYGTNLDENHIYNNLAHGYPSDTAWTFRTYYREFLKQFDDCSNVPAYWEGQYEWINETESAGKYSSISDLKYYHKGSSTGNNVYLYCNAYADFISGLSGNYDIANTHSSTTVEICEIDGKTCIGPLKFSKPVASSDVKAYEEIVGTSNSTKVLGHLLELTNSITCEGATYTGELIRANGNAVNIDNYNNNYNIYAVIEDVEDNVSITINNEYNMYKASVFLMATNGQENATLAGEKIKHKSSITYVAESTPNVTISKKVSKVNTTSVNSTTANVEQGDTVIFKVDVTNTGSKTNVNITDSIPTGLTLTHVGVPDGEDIKWYSRSSWSGITEDIGKDKTITRYFKCKVNDNASGTITNTAKVSAVDKKKGLDEDRTEKKTASASVTVLGYDYELSKSVDKKQVEKGDIIEYTITLTNKNSTKLCNIIIEDALPAGLQFVSYNATDGWQKITGTNNYKYIKKVNEEGIDQGISKGSISLKIKAKVTVPLSTTSFTIDNIAKLTNVENKHGLKLDEKTADEDIQTLTYDYNIEKKIEKIITKKEGEIKSNTGVCQTGDVVVYAITVHNNGTGGIQTLSIEDKFSTADFENLKLYGINLGWELKGNILEYDGSSLDADGSIIGAISGETPKTVYVQATVKRKSTEEVALENTVKILSATNSNGESIYYADKTSTASTTLQTYKVSLYKYLSKDRKDKSEEDKYENPVVIQQGDEITYTIEVVNEGNTNLYNLKIEDTLPEGVESDGYTGSFNCVKLEAGKSAKFTIKAKVTMSNIYLQNIENVATITGVINRNNIDVYDVLNTVNINNKDYIRLDELDIAGKVWEDTNEDGYINDSEVGLEGITVILHNITDGTEISKETDSNGNYKFDKITEVVKGTNRDSNGNYDSSSIHKQYYLEFKYDGIEWQSTIYSGRTNLGADASINSDRKYETDSNAAEIISVRKEFNESLSTITYNQSVKPDGSKGHDLSYEKEETISTLIKDESDEWWKMSSYSFINPDNGNIENLWLSAEQLKNPSVENPKTEYLDYINLGLRNKKVDLKLTSELVSFTETINGQKLEYLINSQGNDAIYEHQLYAADYYYRYDTAYDSIEDENVRKIVEDLKGEESELNLEVLFKTTLTNTSESRVNTVVNEVVQYYDENLLDFDQTRKMRIDSDNDGEFEPEDEYEYIFKVKGIYKDKDGNEINVEGKGKADINSSYKLAIENATGYKKVFIYDIKDSSGNLIELKPGESIEIETSYLVDEDANRNLKISGNTGVISEILAYTTYYKSEYAGSVDMDSNPGNVGTDNDGNDISIEDTAYYEDDTGKSEINFYVKDPNDPSDPPGDPDDPDGPTRKTRELTGFVWEDIEGSISGIGDGIYDSSENKIEAIQVELIEVVKYIDSLGIAQYAEISAGQFKTGSDGVYTINNYKPGCYIVRFTYGNDTTDENNMKYNGQDYKSTTYKTGIESVFDGTTANNNLEVLSKDSNLSDARDDEKRRLETMEYSLEMFNQKAEVLKYEGASDPEASELADLYMYADTVNFIARVEYVKNEIVTIEDKGSTWNTYKNDGKSGDVYDGNYYIENIDFGLIERPINEIKLNKYIKEIKLETSSGEVLLDAKYNPVYDSSGTTLTTEIDRTNSIGLDNLQQLNNTETQQGFRYINVDEELLQGAQISIIYGFIVVNNSEVDYINKKLYGEQANVENLTTQKVLENMTNARNGYEDATYNYKDEIYNGRYEYGKYIGKVHYTGTLTSEEVIATIKVDTILDYVDNSLVFSPIDNGGVWGTAMAQELIDNGYLKEDVYTFVEKDGNQVPLIADINGIEYQTDTKNNLAVTIDDATINGSLSKQLYSTKYDPDKSTGETELIVSTFLSSENESDDMVYENIAEIIKFTTLTGRRTVSTGDTAQTIGNAKVNLVGYVDSDPAGTLGEPDTSIVEKVMLTPPTGADWIDTYVLTRVIIYVVGSIAVITLGILFIPKLVTKIKNRKFIK